MPQRKPRVGPYELFCPACWQLNKLVVFGTSAALTQHLKDHFVQSLGNVNRIIAIA